MATPCRSSANRSDHSELNGDDHHLQCNEDRIGERTALPLREAGQEVNRVEVLDQLDNDTAEEHHSQQPQEAGVEMRTAGMLYWLYSYGLGGGDGC